METIVDQIRQLNALVREPGGPHHLVNAYSDSDFLDAEVFELEVGPVSIAIRNQSGIIVIPLDRIHRVHLDDDGTIGLFDGSNKTLIELFVFHSTPSFEDAIAATQASLG